MDYSKMKNVDKSLSVDDRIGFLKHCASRYEHFGDSPISDAEYDREFAELSAISNDPFFDQAGGEFDEHIHGTLVKHDFVMGSLVKCPMDSLKKWLHDTFKSAKDNSVTLSHKLDGLSLSLLYKNGKLIRALTRGDSVQGTDVTNNALLVKGVPANIACKDEVEIRGEIIKLKKDFQLRWAKDYANERNFAAGTMSLDDSRKSEVVDRQLDFIAYEIIRKTFDFEMDKITFLEQNGFQTLRSSSKRTKNGLAIEQIEQAIKVYMDTVGKERNDLQYLIDGIVVKTNDIKYGESLGRIANNTRPKSAVALKYPPEEAVTKFVGVEANTGRTGKIAPVALLDPVTLGGTIVRRASLHNYGALVGKDAIKIGAIVVIAKKGDIIPQVQRIEKNGVVDVVIPTVCPSCGEPVTWNETGVDIVCNNIACPAQSAKRIDNWFKVIGAKGIGKATITNLVTMEWDGKPVVNCISDMYYKLDNDRQTEHPFRKYALIKSEFGDTTYDNILKCIKSVTDVSLPIFVEALGIARVGSMSKDICDIAPSIEEIDKLTLNDLQGIAGFGPIKAKNFIEEWKAMRPEIEILLKYITIKANKTASDKLKDKKFCFTGSFSSPSRSEMEKLVVENGGKLGSVGKSLTALVFDGECTKGKYQKAIDENVPVITQEDFMKLLE